MLGAVIAGILVLDQFSVEQEPQTTLLPLLLAVYSVGGTTPTGGSRAPDSRWGSPG